MPAEERENKSNALLDDMKAALEGMAKALGADHMLVQGGSRYLAQLSVFSKK